MKREVKAILLGLVLSVGLLTTACPQRISIADIEANPSRYYDKEVAVAGTVEDSYGVSIPVVVRLEGTNVEEGNRVIAESGMNFIVAKGMSDAAEKVVSAANATY